MTSACRRTRSSSRVHPRHEVVFAASDEDAYDRLFEVIWRQAAVLPIGPTDWVHLDGIETSDRYMSTVIVGEQRAVTAWASEIVALAVRHGETLELVAYGSEEHVEERFDGSLLDHVAQRS
jgi:hypothetical protein